jgi:hypothetical protein
MMRGDLDEIGVVEYILKFGVLLLFNILGKRVYLRALGIKKSPDKRQV